MGDSYSPYEKNGLSKRMKPRIGITMELSVKEERWLNFLDLAYS
jgi:hypothetical protein